MNRVCKPHIAAEPAQILEVLGGSSAIRCLAELPLVLSLGEVGVQSGAGVPCKRGGVAHQVCRDRKGRTGRYRDPGHRVEGRVMPFLYGRLGGGHDDVAIFHHLVRRQTSGRLAEIHRAAARVKPHAYLGRSGDLGLEQISTVTWKHVVMIGTRAASRQCEPAQVRGRGGMHPIIGQAGPPSIQGG